MARIRTIKPEFWDSPSTARASAVARLAFIAMWNWADDFGRGTANMKELEGFIFPNDDIPTLSGGKSRSFRDVVAEVVDCFGVLFYEVDGRPYFAIPSWQKHQRNEKRAQAKYPGPDEADSAPDLGIGESSAKVRHDVAESLGSSGLGTGEIGTGEQSFSSEIADAITRPDVQHLLDLLDSEIVANGGKPTGHTKRNQDAMRLLLDRDGRTVEQVEACIRWCQQNEFWRSNILSASKLRDQYDRLRLQAQQQGQQQTARRQGTHLGVIARLQQEEHDAGGGSGAIAPVRELG